MRRTILKHAFVILTVAFLLGLVAGSMAHHPHGRLWMGSHITGILVALMVAVVGLVWPELRLSPRAGKVLFFVTVPMNYYILAALGVAAPALGFPQAIATPQLPPAASWVTGWMTTNLVVATASALTMSVLVVFGLRRQPGQASAGDA
jgi:hypothetical protein